MRIMELMNLLEYGIKTPEQFTTAILEDDCVEIFEDEMNCVQEIID